MNITIKLKTDHIGYLYSVLDPVTEISRAAFSQKTHRQRVITSTLIEPADKLCKKFKNISRKPELFDSKKTYSITLKYHEASALTEYLLSLYAHEVDDYRKHAARWIMNKLDPNFT